MPEISSRLSSLYSETYVKLWQIDESADFFRIFPTTWSIPPIQEHIQSNKYLESMAARFCLWQLMRDLEIQDWDLKQDKRGRPYLDHPAWQVTISHSYPFAAACISKLPFTGIDLEKKGRNIQKIAPRFLNFQELAAWQANELQLTLAWSAKESAYKAWQKPGLSLQKEIQLDISAGKITGKVQESGPFPIYHEIFDDFVVTLVNH